MTEQTVNVPLLRKAVEWAEAEAAKPEVLCSWYQVDTVTQPEVIERSPECGTCYCIAGYVASVVTGLEDPYDSPLVHDGSVCDLARMELGLSESGSSDLFGMFNTIADVRRIAEDLAGERL